MAREIRQGDGIIRYTEDGRAYMRHPKPDGTYFWHCPEDAELANAHNWRDNGGGYVVTDIKRNGKRTTLRFHRAVQERVYGEFWDGETDHLDRNPSNNCRWNLRNVTTSQNQHNQGKPSTNTSGVLGATWDEVKGKWRAQVKLNGKNIFLGFFTDLQLAAIAADFGRVHYHNNSPGYINNEEHRELYVSILAEHSHLFETERPATAIRCLLEIFQARQEELHRHTDNLEITITISPARQVVKVGV